MDQNETNEPIEETKRRRTAMNAGAGVTTSPSITIHNHPSEAKTRPGSTQPIVVNAPQYTPPPAYEPAPEIEYVPVPQPVATTTRTTTSSTPAHIEKRTDINWGNIVKGALIVGAVVLVTVVAISAAAYLATTPLGIAITNSIASALQPVMHELGVAGHLLPNIPGYFADIFGPALGTIGNALGIHAGTGAAAAATTAAINPAHVGAAKALVGGGIGIAAAGTGLSALSHMDLFSHHDVMVGGATHFDTTSTPVSAPTPHVPTVSAAEHHNLAAATAAAAKGASSHAAFDHSAAHGAEELGHATHMGHHATEERHGHANHNTTLASQLAMERAARASQSWAEQENIPAPKAPGGYSETVPAPKSGGSYADQIKLRGASTIEPRNKSYASELTDQTHDLEAALNGGRA